MSETPSQPDDELKGSEQPFVAHLIELRDRLIWAVAAVALAAAALVVLVAEAEASAAAVLRAVGRIKRYDHV